MRISVRASAETLRLINRWSRAWWVEGILGNFTVFFKNMETLKVAVHLTQTLSDSDSCNILLVNLQSDRKESHDPLSFPPTPTPQTQPGQELHGELSKLLMLPPHPQRYIYIYILKSLEGCNLPSEVSRAPRVWKFAAEAETHHCRAWSLRSTQYPHCLRACQRSKLSLSPTHSY